MITIILITIFILGYLAIAFEQPLKLNKAAAALLTGVLCWTTYTIQSQSPETVIKELNEHLGEIASILFFLLGAMTIVEVIDSHNGFEIITQKITTSSKKRLLFIITGITFLLSALLDNLTTAIVMTSVCAKILADKEDRLWFAGMIVIAANAGGAWSPLGDVTTTMLWIGGQITALNIIKELILPSLVACGIPLLLMARRFKGINFIPSPFHERPLKEKKESTIILVAGIILLLSVPVFKTITLLPPFMGMLLALSIMWIINSMMHKKKEGTDAEKFTVAKALQRIDTPSILFFLGILLAVAALQSYGILKITATYLSNSLHNDYLIGIALGMLSSIVDNVPLVAAAQGMYDLSTYPTDHPFWEFLALTTGTGGSAIIIGSAAGVAVMGIEQINLAIVGFIAAIAVFYLENVFFI